MSRKSRRKSIALRCPPGLKSALRAKARGRDRRIPAIFRDVLRATALQPYVDHGVLPEPGARPVLLQLDPELRAAVEALARAEGQSVDYVLLQRLAEQARPEIVTQ